MGNFSLFCVPDFAANDLPGTVVHGLHSVAESNRGEYVCYPALPEISLLKKRERYTCNLKVKGQGGLWNFYERR